jgi:hypothetical protein
VKPLVSPPITEPASAEIADMYAVSITRPARHHRDAKGAPGGRLIGFSGATKPALRMPRCLAGLGARAPIWRGRLPAAGRIPEWRSGQINSKKNQIKPRKIAWIFLDSFGRFGAFQWVTKEKIKKIFSLSHCVSTATSAFALTPVGLLSLSEKQY